MPILGGRVGGQKCFFLQLAQLYVTFRVTEELLKYVTEEL